MRTVATFIFKGTGLVPQYIFNLQMITYGAPVVTYVVVGSVVVPVTVVPSEKDINSLLLILTVTYIFIFKINIKGYIDIGRGNTLMYRVYAFINLLRN